MLCWVSYFLFGLRGEFPTLERPFYVVFCNCFLGQPFELCHLNSTE